MKNISITIYPVHMAGVEPASHEYLRDAAENYVEWVEYEVQNRYPDADVNIKIMPAGDEGFDGGVHCEDPYVQEDVEHIFDRVFDLGYFWPEMRDRCIYCGNAIYITDVPDPDENREWDDIAVEHADDCEWVLTRAHRWINP